MVVVGRGGEKRKLGVRMKYISTALNRHMPRIGTAGIMTLVTHVMVRV